MQIPIIRTDAILATVAQNKTILLPVNNSSALPNNNNPNSSSSNSSRWWPTGA